MNGFWEKAAPALSGIYQSTGEASSEKAADQLSILSAPMIGELLSPLDVNGDGICDVFKYF